MRGGVASIASRGGVCAARGRGGRRPGLGRSPRVLTPREERSFWLHRLHSLAGIIPIGSFVAFHLYENYSALKGADHYNEVSRALQNLPFSLALEIAVIGVPVFFHGIYGLFITATAAPNEKPYARNWMYNLQRAS